MTLHYHKFMYVFCAYDCRAQEEIMIMHAGNAYLTFTNMWRFEVTFTVRRSIDDSLTVAKCFVGVAVVAMAFIFIGGGRKMRLNLCP
ncbi:MAG: hypothetical protein QS721_04020 [Candidatus Endonucleobacter sp. (ex Gigantidas childressi)]|nr:hypothetical protein [Candidatus Endonucleobacter sp. (ex Gigantidas childressi)]